MRRVAADAIQKTRGEAYVTLLCCGYLWLTGKALLE